MPRIDSNGKILDFYGYFFLISRRTRGQKVFAMEEYVDTIITHLKF